jgi:hypothetical protein
MRLHRVLAASLIAAPLGILGMTNAQADILGCNEQTQPNTTEQGDDGVAEDNEAPFVSLSDSVDIITVNPKAAIALEDDSHAETEAGGTSSSTGKSGAPSRRTRTTLRRAACSVRTTRSTLLPSIQKPAFRLMMTR